MDVPKHLLFAYRCLHPTDSTAPNVTYMRKYNVPTSVMKDEDFISKKILQTLHFQTDQEPA